jgi:hypothetical protein
MTSFIRDSNHHHLNEYLIFLFLLRRQSPSVAIITRQRCFSQKETMTAAARSSSKDACTLQVVTNERNIQTNTRDNMLRRPLNCFHPKLPVLLLLSLFLGSPANAWHQHHRCLLVPVAVSRQRATSSSSKNWKLFQSPPDDTVEIMKEETTTTTATNDTPLGRFLRGIWQTGMKETIQINAMVVTKADIPSLGIWMDQSYELKSIYMQGVNAETNEVEKIPLPQVLDTTSSSTSSSSYPRTRYTQYIELYNPIYHKDDAPVKVTPEEVGLVSLRDEVLDSIVFALPVLGFWTATSFMFAKTYNDRYGGNFFDALFGR